MRSISTMETVIMAKFKAVCIVVLDSKKRRCESRQTEIAAAKRTTPASCLLDSVRDVSLTD
jgi:hypothetical protein